MLSSLPLVSDGLRECLERCIVYHEMAITAYDVSRARVSLHRDGNHAFFVNITRCITRENAQISRLRRVLETLDWQFAAAPHVTPEAESARPALLAVE